MTDPLEFIQSALISSSCTKVDLVSGHWYFFFENGASLRVGCLWRIVSAGNVNLSSEDHGQLFGLQMPVDATVQAIILLGDKKVVTVSIDMGTADLKIEVSGESKIEVINTSDGYEPRK
jgi:hypothetical protein